MEVLWFSNTPAGGEDFLKLGEPRGGWMISLDKAIRNKVALSVAFNFARYTEPFECNGVKYFPICKKNWKFNIIKTQLYGDYLDREDLAVYLEIIDKVKPDIIHIFGTENPYSCLVGETNIPVIISIQGNYTVYNHKYFSGIERKYASFRGLNIWSPFTWFLNKSYKHRYRVSSVPKTIREKKNLKNCQYIIGRTDWDRRITRILSPRSIYFHNDEILRDSFYQRKWINPHNKNIIVHTTSGGTLFKGFETVCQALSELEKIGINIEWRVAGVSKDSLLDKVVKNKLKEFYPSKGLILLGSIQEQELIERMLEADIYVTPSHIENSPNSLCEAMILGMPCISTLAGGSSSLLKDKEEGLIIQDGDPWSMAGAILELAGDKEKAIRYGQKARERALIRHNKENIASELLKIYNTIIKE
jgi:glycosyltransferase involved in cell wall biosynthesis